MASTTFKAANMGKPAPRWFRRLRAGMDVLVDGAIIILLATGHKEDSMVMLILRIGYSHVMKAIAAFLANGEVYAQDVPNAPSPNIEKTEP